LVQIPEVSFDPHWAILKKKKAELEDPAFLRGYAG
jgi:hypothetical protein